MLLAVAIAYWWPTLAALASVPSDRVSTFDEDFNAGVMSGNARQTGFSACPNGWCLGPGQTGSLTYHLPPAASEWLGIAIWLYLPERGSNEMVLVSDAGSQVIVRNETLSGERRYVHLAPRTGSAVVRVHVTNGSDRLVLAVDKLTFDYLTGAPRRRVSSLSVFLAAISLGLCVALILPRPLYAALASLVVAAGATLRVAELSRVADLALGRDAALYLHYAQQMDLFSATGFYSGLWGQREPLFILVVRLFTQAFGSSEFQLRLFTTLLSIAAIAAVIWSSSRLLGRSAGLFAGALVALAEPFHREAANGLRLELEIILFLTYLVAAFGRRPSAALWQWGLLGALSGVLSLLRSTYLPVTVGLNALSLLRTSPRHRDIAVGLFVTTALTVLLVAPHRYGLYRVHGNPFHDTTLYARWNANFEFAGRPGFPTLAELQRDGYAGPPISYAEYMLGLHSPSELLTGTLRGYVKLFLRMDLRADFPDALNILFQAFAASGLWLALRRPVWWLPFALVLVVFPTAFLYDRGLVEAYRHTFVAFPLVALAAYLSAEHLFAVLRRAKLNG